MVSKENTPFSQTEAETQRFVVKVYGWMALALIITGFTAIWTSQNVNIVSIMTESRWFLFVLILIEFILVAYLVRWTEQMSANTASLIFIIYSIMNGFTLSIIFIVYTDNSIASTFFITSGTFAVMSIYGYFTKTDLTKFGNLLFMGLIGLVLASFINFLLKSEVIYWINTYAGILIFTGLIAYDTQMIKPLNKIGNEGTDEDKKEAIIGALSLYLDFINLFLKLLRIFGRRK